MESSLTILSFQHNPFVQLLKNKEDQARISNKNWQICSHKMAFFTKFRMYYFVFSYKNIARIILKVESLIQEGTSNKCWIIIGNMHSNFRLLHWYEHWKRKKGKASFVKKSFIFMKWKFREKGNPLYWHKNCPLCIILLFLGENIKLRLLTDAY